jgi:glycosyltransferase involved in cell wall biosynthesis
VDQAGCGVLVARDSVDDLARGIQELLDDPDRELIGKKGRRAVEELYHVGAMAANFEKIFGKVVRK